MQALTLSPNAPRWRSAAKVLVKPKSNVTKDKSYADDLNKERGIVRSRVALLLRSSEIKPFVLTICACVRACQQWLAVARQFFSVLLITFPATKTLCRVPCYAVLSVLCHRRCHCRREATLPLLLRGIRVHVSLSLSQ